MQSTLGVINSSKHVAHPWTGVNVLSRLATGIAGLAGSNRSTGLKLVLDSFTPAEFIRSHLSAHAHDVSIRNAEFERTFYLLNGIDAGGDACVLCRAA